MRSINRVTILGSAGKDAALSYTPNGSAMAKLSIATDERYKDKNDEWQNRTEWHNVVLWAKTAEIAGEYVKKGSRVYIEGRLQTRSWDDKTSGQKKYMTEIVGQELILLDGRSTDNVQKPAPKPATRNQEQELDDSQIPF